MKSRVLDAPFLSCVLLVMSVGVGSLWYRSIAAQRAPQLSNYNWNSHPNTMLVVVPPNYCGCGASPTTLTLQALDHHLDVIIVSDRSSRLLADVEKMHISPKHLTLLTQADAEIFIRFCLTKNLGIARIKNSHIEYLTSGYVTDDFFEKQENA